MKNVFDYRTDAGVLHQIFTRAPRLAATRVANKFKIADGEIIFIKNVKGKEFQYSTWSKKIENPTEFQKIANLLTERGVKRIKKNPGAPLEHPQDPLSPPTPPTKSQEPEVSVGI